MAAPAGAGPAMKKIAPHRTVRPARAAAKTASDGPRPCPGRPRPEPGGSKAWPPADRSAPAETAKGRRLVRTRLPSISARADLWLIHCSSYRQRRASTCAFRLLGQIRRQGHEAYRLCGSAHGSVVSPGMILSRRRTRAIRPRAQLGRGPGAGRPGHLGRWAPCPPRAPRARSCPAEPSGVRGVSLQASSAPTAAGSPRGRGGLGPCWPRAW